MTLIADTYRVESGLVAGELWNGAPVWSPLNCLGGVISGRRAKGWGVAFPGGETRVDPDPQLLLPGSRYSGANGLAVGVATRLKLSKHAPQKGWYGVLRDLGEAEKLSWIPEFNDVHGCRYVGRLGRISEYIAATDALCAAVGLTLKEGEVARWERFGINTWRLSHSGESFALFDAELSSVPTRPGLRIFHVPALVTTGETSHASLLESWRKVCR